MIVFPMAGLSSRFKNAGYSLPKFMLQLGNKSVFEHCVLSFSEYFHVKKFIFIVRDELAIKSFVKEKIEVLGIDNYEIVLLNYNTRGQAETVAKGIEHLNLNKSLTIFNIDTFRPGFKFPHELGDGYLEVFSGSGNNWSFVKPACNETNIVELTTEKIPISNLCSTGLYYFSKAYLFFNAFNITSKSSPSSWQGGEIYVAPLYNHLIKQGFDIRYHLISHKDVVFCGVPAEYELLKTKYC